MRFNLDMTMMGVVHDALRRHLERIATIAARAGDDPRRILNTAVGWELFKEYLRVHHTSEDDALWPAIRQAATGRPDDLALIQALEAEHGDIDPLLEAIDGALADRDSGSERLPDLVDSLVAALSRHLSHEENEGLPLIDAALSEQQWNHFGEVHRSRIGTGASRYLPWLLDGASDDVTASVLSRMPEPIRLAYEGEWRRAYVELNLWGTNSQSGTR